MTYHGVMYPPWMKIAEGYIGVKEIKGVNHHPAIVRMWKWIKRGGIKNDEVPWCAAFVGACLEQVGIISSRFESARSYLDWGVPLDAPAVGCIVVFERGSWQGHVGFVYGQDINGNLLVVGGNQSDEVNVRSFSRSRVIRSKNRKEVIGYRWPLMMGAPSMALLPVLNTGRYGLSTKEV